MKFAALIMAGGRGARIRRAVEKPLVEVGGKPMIVHVLAALKRTRYVDEIFVATSKYTTETSLRVKQLGFKVVETSGEGYHSDLKCAVKCLGLHRPVVTVPADVPLLAPSTLSKVLEIYSESGKPALATYVPRDLCEALGLRVEPSDIIELCGMAVVPAGVNVIDGRYIDEPEIPQADVVLESIDLAVNVNTEEDLSVAKRLIHRTGIPLTKVLAVLR